MAKKRYPIGVQTFKDIIQTGSVYVDKTAVIYRMVSAGKFFFLALIQMGKAIRTLPEKGQKNRVTHQFRCMTGEAKSIPFESFIMRINEVVFQVADK